MPVEDYSSPPRRHMLAESERECPGAPRKKIGTPDRSVNTDSIRIQLFPETHREIPQQKNSDSNMVGSKQGK